MGLFDKFKKNEKKENVITWEDAYEANPSFYSKPDGSPFGAFALTEDTDTILPKAPRYAVSGTEVTEYKLMLVSITKDGVIGDCDYFDAIKKLEAFAVDSNDDNLLIRGLSLSELEDLLK